MAAAARLIRIACCGVALLCLPVWGADVTVAFGINVPPYVLPDTKPPSGLELELFRAALAVRGHTMRPQFVTREAVASLLLQHKVDAAQRMLTPVREGDGVYYAYEATVPYRNAAFSLKKNRLSIYSVADLRGKSVVSFPGASRFLGSEFGAAIKDNMHYVEMTDERDKLSLLVGGNAQVYVGDVNIFAYIIAGFANTPEVVQHRIFLPTTLQSNSAAFHNPVLRDDFDAGLKAIKENGLYQQIVRRYLK